MCLRERGGAVVALRDGFHLFDFADRRDDAHRRPRARPSCARGSTTARSTGRAASSPATWTMRRRNRWAALYRLDPDLTVTRLDGGHHRQQRAVLQPGWRHALFADSWTRCIFAYGYDSHDRRGDSAARCSPISSKRDCAATRTVPRSTPRVVWSRRGLGGRLVRFAPDGTVDRLVGMPVDSITSLNFGGAELDILYVTSMARPFHGRPRQEREAGGLFAVHGLGVRGVPEPRFKG